MSAWTRTQHLTASSWASSIEVCQSIGRPFGSGNFAGHKKTEPWRFTAVHNRTSEMKSGSSGQSEGATK